MRKSKGRERTISGQPATNLVVILLLLLILFLLLIFILLFLFFLALSTAPKRRKIRIKKMIRRRIKSKSRIGSLGE